MPLKLHNTHKHFGNNRPQAVVKATEVILITDTRHCDKNAIAGVESTGQLPCSGYFVTDKHSV